jgi:hypothetical protein
MLSAVIIVIVLAVSGLALYAMRSKVRLKVSASLLKLASFSIEVESVPGRAPVRRVAANGEARTISLLGGIPVERPAERAIRCHRRKRTSHW